MAMVIDDVLSTSFRRTTAKRTKQIQEDAREGRGRSEGYLISHSIAPLSNRSSSHTAVQVAIESHPAAVTAPTATMSDLFVRKHLPDIDEDWHYHLTGTFQDLIHTKSWTFQEFFDYVDGGDGLVAWTGEECCVLPTDMDPPDEHEYSISMVATSQQAVAKGGKPKKYKLSITTTKDSKSTEHASSTMQGLLMLCHANKTPLDVTFKLFATNPRQPFPSLQHEPTPTGGLASLCFQFCGLTQSTLRSLTRSPAVPCLQLRQCVIADGWSDAWTPSAIVDKCLMLSCTQAEFCKFIPALANNAPIQKLELLLHFWLQSEWFAQFCDTLQGNTTLQELHLSYLDIGDADWKKLLQALHAHSALRVLDLSFTEKFVDTFRRLDEERRTQRSQAVLELVQSNRNIQVLTWPEFQHDEEIMKTVTGILAQRAEGSN